MKFVWPDINCNDSKITKKSEQHNAGMHYSPNKNKMVKRTNRFFFVTGDFPKASHFTKVNKIKCVHKLCGSVKSVHLSCINKATIVRNNSVIQKHTCAHTTP